MDRMKWIRRAIYLSWFTIVYNLIEGVISISLGLNGDSIALAGFGADSLIEVASAILVLWRFKGESSGSGGLSVEREKKATYWIGVLFVLLALLTLVASGMQLFQHSHPETTLPGLLVSSVSLGFMFYLWSAKRKTGLALDSRTVIQDATCSLTCIQLSVVLLLGSVVYWILPAAWWADSVTALLISIFIAREGWEAIQATRSEDFSGGCCGCDG